MRRTCHFLLLLFLVLAVPARSEECSIWSPTWTLKDFPAHRTDLTSKHLNQISNISTEIADSLDRRKPIRCIRLIGHAATWRKISEDEYDRRAQVRAETAAELLSGSLETFGVTPKIFARDEFDDEAFCEPVDGVDVTLIFDGRGDDCPLLPNLVSRTDTEARSNRAENRRVALYAIRVGEPFRHSKNKRSLCAEPDAYCVNRHHYMAEGVACTYKGHLPFSWSTEDLEGEVERGEATLICDSR